MHQKIQKIIELMCLNGNLLYMNIPKMLQNITITKFLLLTGVKSHLRKTVKKIMPSQETITKLQNTKVSIPDIFHLFHCLAS